MSLHKEVEFENDICARLAAHEWLYEEGDAARYDRGRALFPADALVWVQATWETLQKNLGSLRKRCCSRRNRALMRSVCRSVLAMLGLAVSFAASAGGLSAGDYRFELQAGGRTRSYLMHVPPKAGPLPLVVSLHGGGGNAEQHRATSGMDAAADRDGYVVVYPNGSGRAEGRFLTWNAGNCCAYAKDRGVDDVGFIARVIEDAQRRASVDARRLYVAGHSNGGMMAHRFGEAMPDRVAAIASVAGVHVPAAESGSRAVPVLHIHSVDDPHALYRGGYGPPPLPFAPRILHSPVEAMVEAWLTRDGCNAVPKEAAFRESGADTARRLDYSGCRDGAKVTLWKLTGAGHAWPGGAPARERTVGPSTRVIDANTEIWKFFSQFALPAR